MTTIKDTLVAHSSIKLNNELFRRETIDGEEHIVVPCSTMPPDIVMNGIFYPEDEVKKAYETLEGTPSPLGHPKIDGEMVSAYEPRGVNKYGVGAWNRNVTYTDKIHYQKAINIRIAKASPHGGDLIEAIEKEQPIHTSTGLFCTIVPVKGEHNGKEYDGIATNIRFDHDAILLQEPGAATPKDGTGIYVHKNKEHKMNEENVTVNKSILDALLSAFKSNKEEPVEHKEPIVGDQPEKEVEQNHGGEQLSEEDLETKIKEVVANCVRTEIANALQEVGKQNSEVQQHEDQQQNNSDQMLAGFALSAGANFTLNSEDENTLIDNLPE